MPYPLPGSWLPQVKKIQNIRSFNENGLPGPPGQTRGYAGAKNTKNYILCFQEINSLHSVSEFFVSFSRPGDMPDASFLFFVNMQKHIVF